MHKRFLRRVALAVVPATLLGAGVLSPVAALASNIFNRSGAANWALANYGASSIPNYKFYGSDCTNFVSSAWVRGGGLRQNSVWHQAYWYDVNGNYLTEGSYAFIRVKDFRAYWYNRNARYLSVQGRAALTSAYSPALLGDAYIFDSGDSSRKPDWEHAAIEVRYSGGYDEYAQHSSGKVTDWRTWYRKHTSAERRNMERSGHGIRIITPYQANPNEV